MLRAGGRGRRAGCPCRCGTAEVVEKPQRRAGPRACARVREECASFAALRGWQAVGRSKTGGDRAFDWRRCGTRASGGPRGRCPVEKVAFRIPWPCGDGRTRRRFGFLHSLRLKYDRKPLPARSLSPLTETFLCLYQSSASLLRCATGCKSDTGISALP